MVNMLTCNHTRGEPMRRLEEKYIARILPALPLDRFQHPPVRVTRERASTRDIHNDVAAHRKERARRKCFSEEIG
eukprot:6214316-Pleurochrysis_carterae.AAC.2